MKRKIIFITCLSLCLTSFQFVNGQSVFAAEVCQGPAAYPPDLPGCLDPVVAAEQAAAAKAAADAAAAAAAARAAQDAAAARQAVEAAAEREAAAAAAAKAAVDKAAADALAEKIRQ